MATWYAMLLGSRIKISYFYSSVVNRLNSFSCLINSAVLLPLGWKQGSNGSNRRVLAKRGCQNRLFIQFNNHETTAKGEQTRANSSWNSDGATTTWVNYSRLDAPVNFLSSSISPSPFAVRASNNEAATKLESLSCEYLIYGSVFPKHAGKKEINLPVK